MAECKWRERMRQRILLRLLALLLSSFAAGCYQQAGNSPRSLEPEMQQLPARRSERALALRATSSLPLTVIGPTPWGTPAETPTLAPAVQDPAFITPRSPDAPSMDVGGGSGFTTFSLPTPTHTPRPPGVDEVSPECVHTILGGDTLYDIALQYESTVADMLKANPSLSRDNPVIYPGQQLVIASCPELQELLFPTPVATIPVATPVPAIVSTALPPGHRLHVVRSGETLYSISLNYGLTIEDLVAANELLDPDRLDVGQEILIPPRG